KLTSMCDMVGQFIQKKEEEKQIEEDQAAKTRYWKIIARYDDDDYDYTIAITHTEPDNSLSMGDEHLDTIPATESNEFIKFSVKNLVPNLSESEGEYEYEVIKSSVKNLVPSPSEFKGILDTLCYVHLVNNPTPLEAKDQFEIVINSNNDYSSSDDDSLYYENIEYVEASPHDSEFASLEVEKIVIPEDEEIEDDNLRQAQRPKTSASWEAPHE
nr:hypothetical protein [Tanacetum cinerariifolium]